MSIAPFGSVCKITRHLAIGRKIISKESWPARHGLTGTVRAKLNPFKATIAQRARAGGGSPPGIVPRILPFGLMVV